MGAVLDYLFGIDEATKRGRELDNRLRQLNQSEYDNGEITRAQYEQTKSNIDAGSADQYSSQLENDFWEGYEEGKANVTGTARAIIAEPVNLFFGAIPWQVWALLGAWILWELGLFHRLKGALAK